MSPQFPPDRSRLPVWPGLLLGLLCLPAHAEDGGALLDMDIAQLMQLPVVTASRHEEALADAPAVITVLDGEDLRRHGYRSVAEALAQVPGLYVVDDGVGNYVVVRGFDSGQRAYGRTVKVMLDGQPLGNRSNGTQLLGPELIPLGMVDRIEVIQGPGSALYGADAFLGVINIITRDDPPTARASLSAGHAQGSGGGLSVDGEAEASLSHGPWSAASSASGGRDNRSGQVLPDSSPDYADFSDPRSSSDLSRPLSAYTRLRYSDEQQTHTLALHASELDANGEFLDFGTLDPANRIAEIQQTLSWLSEWQPTDDQHYQLRLAHAWGGPDDDLQRLSLGQSGGVYPEVDYGYRSSEAGLEAQFQHGHHQLVAGTDASWDDESPFQVFSVSNNGITDLSSADNGHFFRNTGAYLQYQWLSPDGGWSPSLNWRHDNSDHYGDHNSYRLGLSHALSPTLRAKLLYGTSFQAPNAYELYAQPVYAGDVLGNPGLRPETSASTDFQLLWQARQSLLFSLTAYHMSVHDLIELQPYGINQQWTNRGTEVGNGLSGEMRWQFGAQQLSLSSAWQKATVSVEQPLTPEVNLPTSSAPRLINRGEWLYRLPLAELGVEARYASQRRASDSNISMDQAYQLPGYTIWRLHALHRFGRQSLGLVLDNALDRRYAEPGYGGVDLPGARRTLWLTWSWEAGS